MKSDQRPSLTCGYVRGGKNLRVAYTKVIAGHI